MDNKNLTLKWIDTLGNNKIVFERGIIDGTKNRGIYGIFIIDNKQQTEYCASPSPACSCILPTSSSPPPPARMAHLTASIPPSAWKPRISLMPPTIPISRIPPSCPTAPTAQPLCTGLTWHRCETHKGIS